MRVAAVQLNSGADRAANLAAADRLTRAAAADGASLIVLPEKWTAMGRHGGPARGGRDARRAGRLLGARSSPRELAVDLIAGSILERVDGQEKLANTSVHVGPDGEVRAIYRKMHMFDVEVGGHVYRESELEEPGEEIVLTAREAARAWECPSATTCASPSSTGSWPCAGALRDRAAGRLHAGDHPRSLGDAGARAGDREPGLRDRRQPGRRPPRRDSTPEGAR